MLFAVALIAPRAIGALARLGDGLRARVSMTAMAVDLCADCVGPARR